jgi:hypothetical protein
MRIIGVVLPLWLLSDVHFTFEIASVLISVEFSGEEAFVVVYFCLLKRACFQTNLSNSGAYIQA